MSQPSDRIELAVEDVARNLTEQPDAIVLDVREPWEYETCRIEGSVNIPLGSVPARMDELPRDVPIYALCHHGMRSLRATLWLREQGFDQIFNIAGGIDRWSVSVDPSIRRYG